MFANAFNFLVTVLANTAVLCMCAYCLFAGTWHLWRALLQHPIMLRLFFIVQCGIVRFLRYACIQSRHHPDPLSYLCAKFCFLHDLHC